MIIDSPDQSNLSLLGTFPAKQSSYGIVNNSITIIGGQYGHQWGYERDAFVALKLNSSTFSVEKYETAQVPQVTAPSYGPTCMLSLYGETYVNDSEFAFLIELTGYTNGNGGVYRCYSYDFNGTTLYQGAGSQIKSNFIIRSTHNLTFFEIERISSRTGSGYDSTYWNLPPVFSTEGGWARVNPKESLSSEIDEMYYSNYNGSISGVMSLCNAENEGIEAGLSNVILHVCSEFNLHRKKTMYHYYSESINGNVSKLAVGKGTITSHGVIQLSEERIIISQIYQWVRS